MAAGVGVARGLGCAWDRYLFLFICAAVLVRTACVRRARQLTLGSPGRPFRNSRKTRVVFTIGIRPSRPLFVDRLASLSASQPVSADALRSVAYRARRKRHHIGGWPRKFFRSPLEEICVTERCLRSDLLEACVTLRRARHRN